MAIPLCWRSDDRLERGRGEVLKRLSRKRLVVARDEQSSRNSQKYVVEDGPAVSHEPDRERQPARMIAFASTGAALASRGATSRADNRNPSASRSPSPNGLRR